MVLFWLDRGRPARLHPTAAPTRVRARAPGIMKASFDAWVAANRARIVDALFEYVAIDTVSPHEERAFGFVTSYLEDVGFEIETSRRATKAPVGRARARAGSKPGATGRRASSRYGPTSSSIGYQDACTVKGGGARMTMRRMKKMKKQRSRSSRLTLCANWKSYFLKRGLSIYGV